MKKLMFAAAVAAAGLAFGIESANSVGYTTKTVAADTFYLIGVQFEKIGQDGVAGLNDVLIMNGIEPVAFDNMLTDAARIDVLVGNVYQQYFYINDADDGTEVFNLTGWADGAGNLISTADLALGDGFWFHAPTVSAGATLTVAGQVTESTEIALNVPSGKAFAIRANPFPLAVNLKDVATSGITAVAFDNMLTDAARIDVLVGNVYQQYFYISDADDGSETFDKLGWADGAGNLIDSNVIDVGASFWINSPAAGTLTFTR